MRSKHMLIVLSVVAALAAVAVIVYAGNPNNPPGPPETTSSHTLEHIYDRLATGAAGTQITFTEPISGPTAGTGHTLDEIMAVAPSVDDTNGATASQVVSGTTYWSLRNGAWGLQIGTMPDNAGVPKTGQTGCWDADGNSIACTDTGQDGDHQKGVAWPDPRFITGATGIVTDTLTGLIWLENANCTVFFSGDSTGQNNRSWSNALTATNSLESGYCGLTDGSSAGDWRLPNVRELQSLIDYGEYDPALPDGHPFTGVQSHYYWSSTTHAVITCAAWRVGLYGGMVYHDGKSFTYYVWPVRGGQ